MPRKKRCSSPFELMDDDFDEDASSQSSPNGNPPIQRNAANARERARMRVLSSAFGRLKTKLPNIPADTKLSKLDTLRLATMYIKQLKAVVEGETPMATNRTTGDHDIEGPLNDTPSCYLQLHSATQSMNWPFGLHHQINNSNSSSTRSHISPSGVSNGNVTTTSWCQTEGNVLKQSQSRYEMQNYNHQQQQHHQHHHEQEQGTGHYHDNASYLLTPSTPQNSQEITWYSETPPSPDLSNSSGGGYDSSHHQRHSLIMEHLHLSHIQLTPPPTHHYHSSASHSFQQNHIPSHHHHHHQSRQNAAHHHTNTSNLAAASIR